MSPDSIRYKTLVSGITLCIGQLCASSGALAAVAQAEYDATIQAARAGSTAPTIERLRAWHLADPADQRTLHDLIVVQGWAGNFNAALAVVEQLAAPIPAYVLKSLAHAAGAVGRWSDAEKWQRQVLRETPDDIDARTGLVSALFAQQRSAEAVQYVQSVLPTFGSAYRVADVPTIMLLASLHSRRGEHLYAADAYQHPLRLNPQSRDAFRAYILALNASGMPYLAARTADRQPDLFSAEEQRLIAHTAAALTVNFGQAQLAIEHKQPRSVDRSADHWGKRATCPSCATDGMPLRKQSLTTGLAARYSVHRYLRTAISLIQTGDTHAPDTFHRPAAGSRQRGPAGLGRKNRRSQHRVPLCRQE